MAKTNHQRGYSDDRRGRAHYARWRSDGTKRRGGYSYVRSCWTSALKDDVSRGGRAADRKSMARIRAGFDPDEVTWWFSVKEISDVWDHD